MIQRLINAEWKSIIDRQKKNLYCRKGYTLFQEGAPVTGVYFICSGKVKVFVTNPDRRVDILNLASVGYILGHRGLTQEKTYPVSAVTLEDSSIAFIPMDDFIKIMNENLVLYKEMVTFFAEELRQAEYRFRCFSQMTVKQRLAKVFLDIYKVFGEIHVGRAKVLGVTLSRQELADMAGSSLEEIIRTISQMKKEGLIAGIGKNISIRAKKKLLQLIEGFPYNRR